MASAVQGKYFLVEEGQARLSAEEGVVELGFLLSNIHIPEKSRASRETMSVFTRFFRSRPTLVGSPVSSSLSLEPKTSSASEKASLVRATSMTRPTSSVSRPSSVMRESKSILQYPTCMLRVYACEEEMAVDKIKLPLESDKWREVFQSDVHRIINLVPVTISALLLLPIPPIVLTKGIDKRDRALRFELWVGPASTKRNQQPDMLSGIHETTLGKVLRDIGSPKKFAHSPTSHSQWYTIFLSTPEVVSQSQEDQSQLDVRVGFPDRLISVSVPATDQEEEVTEWRLSPLFSGPTLRGLTFSPVSRGFQAPVSEGADLNELQSTMIEPKKKHRRNVNNASTLMEFREEMAEMPLNLIIPACYLDQAAAVLDQVSHQYVQKTRNDITVMKKLAQNDLALTSSDLVQKKTVESIERLERFAMDVSQKSAERATEMREIAQYYRNIWTDVVLGGVSPADKKRLAIHRKIKKEEGENEPLILGSGMNQIDHQEEDLKELPPPPSTPNPFADVILARHSNDEDVDDEEDRQELLMKDDFEKVVGLSSTKPGETLNTFRPSTSRKDRRLRFMPINMHIQVLTVRETVVRRLPVIIAKKSSNSGNTGTSVRQRLRSVADLVSSLGTSNQQLLQQQQSTSQAQVSKNSSSHPGENGQVVPPISEEAEGPLILTSRRKGRQSIMQSTLNMEESPSNTRLGRLTSTSSAKAPPGEEDEDDDKHAEDAESFFYDTISAGAPSAHNLPSKAGGLWQMLRELTKAKEEMRRTRDDKSDVVSKVEAYRKAKEMEWTFAERVDVVLPQAVSIVAGSVIARLFVMAAEYSASVVGGFEEPDDEVAQSIVKHGFLIGWESLLSTHGKELAMLGDLFYAVRYISDHVIMRLEMFTPKDEGDEEKDLLDECLSVRMFRTNSKVKKSSNPSQDHWVDAAQWIGPGTLDDGTVWLIVARLPSTVVEKLPKVLREYVERSAESTSLFTVNPSNFVVDLEQVQPKPLSWTCVLFTQGINEMQNIANMMGSRALQEEINEFSCLRLVEYCRRRFEFRPQQGSSVLPVLQKKTSVISTSLQSREAQAKDEERKRRAEVAYKQSLMWAAKLKVAVSNQASTSKSFEILQNSADLVRWLSGIRIASCKSAKDRTAMSLTWEEARILHNVHFVRNIALLDLANLFREHGTRLINVHKNTGVPRYAFNKTQRSFLPEFYRPPPNTIGGYFGMSNVT